VSTQDWTPGEMLAVAASSQVQPTDRVLVGLGLPQVAAVLAKRTHAREVTLLLELGVFNPAPTESAMGIADPRMWEGATAFGGMLDVLGYMLHRGRVTLGMLGSLQVDPRGNVNSTLVTQPDGTSRRFNGSGGGNDIASLAGRIVVIMRHDPRKFRRTVDFVTSPGCGSPEQLRSELGLPGLGTVAIVTDRAVIEVCSSGASLVSIHPGETADSVLGDTPMSVSVPDGGVLETEAPSQAQLDLIRTELDPEGWYTS
jgi:glutaconate CoA-transferase subunit B